jgi:hypothetical protein
MLSPLRMATEPLLTVHGAIRYGVAALFPLFRTYVRFSILVQPPARINPLRG